MAGTREAIRFCFAQSSGPAAPVSSGSVQRGFVAGRRGAAAAPGRVVDFRAVVRRAARVFFAAGLRRVVAGFFPAVAPVDTRVECLGRWRTAFRGAASAIDAALNATSSAMSSTFA
jgi:hypothetical protein